MRYDPFNHNRRSTRLRGYDYSRTGTYFVTMCTNGRECLFGEIDNEEMRLNQLGKIVVEEWLKTKEIRPSVKLDEFVVMPNHVHAILKIKATPVGATRRVAPTKTNPGPRLEPGSLGAIIGQFKSISAKRINNAGGIPGCPVWQRNFHDHIIRNEDDMERIRKYIRENPRNWPGDDENPQGNR